MIKAIKIRKDYKKQILIRLRGKFVESRQRIGIFYDQIFKFKVCKYRLKSKIFMSQKAFYIIVFRKVYKSIYVKASSLVYFYLVCREKY